MELTLKPNVLCREDQTITFQKVATLIGANGSGKSTILQSIFEQKIKKEIAGNLQIICFSSGQNENFSKSFSQYLSKERRKGAELGLDVFYFNKSWSKLLIFLATAQKKEGKVRTFLREYGYVQELDDSTKLDNSSQLECKFKIDKQFSIRVQEALKQEEKGEIETLRSTPYFRSLESFIEKCVQSGYEFDSSLKKKTINLTADKLFQVTFASALSEDYSDRVNADPVVSFFVQAADNDYFLDKTDIELHLKNGLEMDQLSDGEYQLLFLYALIDLFDSENTLFLLDEADSHLHFRNIEKLWKILHSIKGHTITTTHLLDSITSNEFSSLKVVEKGKITEANKIKQLINRLSILSRAKSAEFEICGKITHMALMDDYNDWTIFLRLAERKGLDIARLQGIQAIKKASSYGSVNEAFGKAKMDWVNGLSKAECELQTRKIFLLCDRDEAAIQFNSGNGVQLTGQQYQNQIRQISWPSGTNVDVYLLAWKRREIKHYLLSYTALRNNGKLTEINDDTLATAYHLRQNDPADNDQIRQLPSDKVKGVMSSLIDSEEGLDLEKLQTYINLIPADEISEDIENMYNFIVEKL
jgi:ABC-type cobalamin/Fe3+-siderophores transport system ATPase subunit